MQASVWKIISKFLDYKDRMNARLVSRHFAKIMSLNIKYCDTSTNWYMLNEKKYRYHCTKKI